MSGRGRLTLCDLLRGDWHAEDCCKLDIVQFVGKTTPADTKAYHLHRQASLGSAQTLVSRPRATDA